MIQGNPEEMRSAAGILASVAAGLQGYAMQVNVALSSAAPSWQDSNQKRFAEPLTNVAQQLSSYAEILEDSGKQIEEIAARYEEALRGTGGGGGNG